MHQAMVNIMLDRIRDQFISEDTFCKNILELPIEIWSDWKKGLVQLQNYKMQQIKNLFSDYEWMLIQKIVSQTIMFPEKRNYASVEYKRLKTVIANTWIKSGVAKVELITQQRFSDRELLNVPQKHVVVLRVVMNYGEWGYDDILEFFMPGIVQQQIEESKVDLIEWLDENLTDTYAEENTQHKGND